MKKRLLLLISAVVLIGSVIGGTTFALFTASTPTQHGSFTAGTLTVALTDAAGAPLTAPFMTYSDLAPGDTVGPFQAWVKNTGSLDLVYNFSFARVGTTNAESDALAAALLLKVEREGEGGAWVNLGEHTVQEWTTGPVSEWQPALASQGMAHFRYTPSLPLGTGNPAQAGSVLVTLLVSATQTSVVNGPGGTVTGIWNGEYTGDLSNPNRPDEKPIWPFVANVTQTGNTFSGTMTEPDDPGLGTTAISGTITGTTITGTRLYPVDGLPFDWHVDFTGTIQPNGTVVIGTRGTDSTFPWNANKE